MAMAPTNPWPLPMPPAISAVVTINGQSASVNAGYHGEIEGFGYNFGGHNKQTHSVKCYTLIGNGDQDNILTNSISNDPATTLNASLTGPFTYHVDPRRRRLRIGTVQDKPNIR